jgi:chromosome segregation ATPase
MTATVTPPADNSASFLDNLQAELAQLAAANAALLADFQTSAPRPATTTRKVAPNTEPSVAALRSENAALKTRFAELERQLASAPPNGNEATRQRDLEAILEEKSEVIRTLHHKIEELQEKKSSSSGEIVQALGELDEERRRLLEEQEKFKEQMRESEMALAKERAELARLRAILERQQTNLQRELEGASRDPQLRERLQHLQRPGSNAELPHPVAPAPTNTTTPPPTKKTGSGLFRRLFGGAQT